MTINHLGQWRVKGKCDGGCSFASIEHYYHYRPTSVHNGAVIVSDNLVSFPGFFSRSFLPVSGNGSGGGGGG